MPPLSRVVLPLRVLLVLVLATLLAAQVAGLPWAVAQLPDDGLRGPLLAAGVLVLACAEAVVVCTWRLLALVAGDRVFSAQARPWVDAVVRLVAAAEVLLLAATAYAAAAGAPPGLPAALLGLAVVGAAVGLLVVVLRALLRHATTLHDDLEAVI
ncbi:DUF2975 domain-containing protein [Geodermatophilus sp. SYSU D01119]